jgi:hypothetical protein
MERQRILTGPNPPTFIAIVDEGVLRRTVGNSEVMVRQCEHLLRCAEQPDIQLHVVPAAAGAHAGLAGGFILAKGSDFEVAHLDNPLRAQVVDRRDAIDKLIRRWEAVRSEALPRALSIDVIREVAKTWQT